MPKSTLQIVNRVREIGGIFVDMMVGFAEHSYKRVLTSIKDRLVTIHEEYFNRQAGPEGGWVSLSPRTVKKKGFDTILIEYNEMRSSLLFDAAENHVQDIEDAYLVWGTSDPKAAFHQEGVQSRNLPARPFVGLNTKDVDEFVNLIADEAVESLKP